MLAGKVSPCSSRRHSVSTSSLEAHLLPLLHQSQALGRGGCNEPREKFKGYTVSRGKEVAPLLWFHSKINSAAWKEIFYPSSCLSLHVALRDQRGMEAPRPSALITQMSTSTSWWLLYLQGGGLQQGGPGAGDLHSCPTHAWAQGFERWRGLTSLWWLLLDMKENS